MRIFVGEYVCGGGFIETELDEIPSSLRREGAAMLAALVADLSEVAETVVPIDARFAPPTEASEVIQVDPDALFWGQWAKIAAECDHAVIVAPESDGKLAQGIGMLRSQGVDVIASSGDFLRTTSDKSLTSKVLHGAQIAHPLTMSLTDLRHEKELSGFSNFVVKPVDGCGTQEIQRFDNFKTARAHLKRGLILQNWCEGRAVSIGLIASSTQQVFLPAVSQSICEKTCTYGGGQGPLDADVQRRATVIASRAVNAMPPTAKGFVGLDLLIGDRPSEDMVIEINPRLTTSYVGLRKMINGNLAARLLDLETGPVSCRVAQDEVTWTPEGIVSIDQVVCKS